MNFNNKRYISKGVDSSVSPLLQLFMWHCIDALPPRDYLQVFELSSTQNKIKIRHIQEQPEYSKEYLLIADAPVFGMTGISKKTPKPRNTVLFASLKILSDIPLRVNFFAFWSYHNFSHKLCNMHWCEKLTVC